MTGVAVVHLVRKGNGTPPFGRFLASYRENPAGIPHDLVILYKGLREEETTPYAERLAGLAHRSLFVTDKGFDLDAYFWAARQLEHARICFLNSYSRILAPRWLAQLAHRSEEPGVGLVGATGSWQSIAGGYTREQKRIDALPPVSKFSERAMRILRDKRPGAMRQRVLRVAHTIAGSWRPARDFPPFPNAHLRTNAFMGARELLLRIRTWPVRSKFSAYKFESGRDGLSGQVKAMGLRALIVGRDGQGYEPGQWHLSNTFWQSQQENLLVSDNQTELYLASDFAKRSELSQYAWGDLANPA